MLPWLSWGLGPTPGEREEPQDGSTGVQSQQGVAVGGVGPGGMLSWGGEEEGQCRLCKWKGRCVDFHWGGEGGRTIWGLLCRGTCFKFSKFPVAQRHELSNLLESQFQQAGGGSPMDRKWPLKSLGRKS